MGINLQKGQRIDLTKGNTGLSEVLMGLGWEGVLRAHRKISYDISASFDQSNKQAAFRTRQFAKLRRRSQRNIACGDGSREPQNVGRIRDDNFTTASKDQLETLSNDVHVRFP